MKHLNVDQCTPTNGTQYNLFGELGQHKDKENSWESCVLGSSFEPQEQQEGKIQKEKYLDGVWEF